MSDAVWVRGYYGERYVLVDGREVLDLHTEAEARRFLEELGEQALEAIDPRALPPGLRADFQASASREDQLTVLAQMLSSGKFTVVRLQRPFHRLDAVKSVNLSDLIEPKLDDPPVTPKETFTYEVRIVDELGEPVEGVPVTLSVSGSSRRLETDGDGRVKVDDATSGSTVVQLPDLVALQDALRPRWEQPRSEQWLDEPDDHTYVDCSAPLPSVQVRAGRLHTIVVQPRVICARILELLFDTNKCFLLPSALEHIRKVRKLYDTRPRAKVLIVGHTDITGDPSVNDPLSLNRAKAVKAYLRDDVQTWLDFFEPHMHPKARWGPHEEQLMLQAVLAESGEDLTDTPLRHFQATRGLDPDGKLGPITREALVAEYMSIDGTTLPEGIEPIAHGCGENFPLEEEEGQDAKTKHAHDRRVELFFFDGDLGVLPSPSAGVSPPGSPEYPEWRSRSHETRVFHSEGLRELLELALYDDARRPMPGAPFLIQFGDSPPIAGHADERGVAATLIPSICPERVAVSWGGRDHQPGFEYHREVFVDCEGDDAVVSDVRKLHNLGYSPDFGLDAAARSFQMEVGVDAEPVPAGAPHGVLPEPTAKALQQLFRASLSEEE